MGATARLLCSLSNMASGDPPILEVHDDQLESWLLPQMTVSAKHRVIADCSEHHARIRERMLPTRRLLVWRKSLHQSDLWLRSPDYLVSPRDMLDQKKPRILESDGSTLS